MSNEKSENGDSPIEMGPVEPQSDEESLRDKAEGAYQHLKNLTFVGHVPDEDSWIEGHIVGGQWKDRQFRRLMTNRECLRDRIVELETEETIASGKTRATIRDLKADHAESVTNWQRRSAEFEGLAEEQRQTIGVLREAIGMDVSSTEERAKLKQRITQLEDLRDGLRGLLLRAKPFLNHATFEDGGSGGVEEGRRCNALCDDLNKGIAATEREPEGD